MFPALLRPVFQVAKKGGFSEVLRRDFDGVRQTNPFGWPDITLQLGAPLPPTAAGLLLHHIMMHRREFRQEAVLRLEIDLFRAHRFLKQFDQAVHVLALHP